MFHAESKRHKKLVEEHFEALDSEGDQSGDEDSIEKSDAESGAEDSEDEDSGKDIPKPESEATRLSQKKLPSRLQNGLKSGGTMESPPQHNTLECPHSCPLYRKLCKGFEV